MAIVVGTAGHIDHGKTALLRAMTGIDADRLPEERRRGMTIDVGYAHLGLSDGGWIDFVDVPGHDRLVGNMLVGAGEIDAALLVVAADDGPRAQTVEHLELLDGLGIAHGLVAVTKSDVLAPDDSRRVSVPGAVRALLAPTLLAGAPVVLVSSTTGDGLGELRVELERLAAALQEAGAGDLPAAPHVRLAVDRAFAVRGRGAVVTGSLRGGRIEAGMTLNLVPGAADPRIREVQVHGAPVGSAGPGRVALNLAVDAATLRRGLVVTDDPAVVATDRLLVALRPPAGASSVELPSGVLRVHIGTEQVDAVLDHGSRSTALSPSGERVAVLRLSGRVAAAPGDRFVLRRPSPASTVAGGRVLDAMPPTGVSRRRATTERLLALAAASPLPAASPAPSSSPTPGPVLALHGALPHDRWLALGGAGSPAVGPLVLAVDVLDGLATSALAAVASHHVADPGSAGIPLPRLRALVARELRRGVTISAADASGAAASLVDGLVAAGRLARAGDRVRDPGRGQDLPPSLVAAMDRLESLLATPAPPSFAAAVRDAACPVEGVRRLEATGRLVRLAPDLAFAASTYRELEALALSMADGGPLTPAAFRDATGTSRRYVLAVLEDLDRRGLLVRTPEGHRRPLPLASTPPR